MKQFGQPTEWWEEKNGYWTAKEIAQQPGTWKKTLKQIQEIRPELDAFLEQTAPETIIFTGAGTSEFVGNSIWQWLAPRNGFDTASYATTDLTTDPSVYVDPEKSTLLVSFGRSGNSPESIGAVDTVNAWTDKAKHLFITCNNEGALAKRAETDETCFDINLTPETHDQSFAMTSSFSNMMLAALLTFSGKELEEDLPLVAEKTEALLENWPFFKDIVDSFDFGRIVYLGSNGLKGIAQESALKMCELTGGNVDTTYDTPLGFRHGPKSVINDRTLTVVYLSDDPYARKYEMDIVKEISGQRKGDKLLVVSSKDDAKARELADWFVSLDNGKELPSVLLGLEYIPVAQMLGLFKSLAMGYGPDNPCPTGEVNRVVKGVTIYPYKKEK